MRELRILHSADLHLDSPFEGLRPAKAAVRRAEQRVLLRRLSDLAISERVDLVLLSGDLLDSDKPYRETITELMSALSRIPVPVVISPGNHDYYTLHCPYARPDLPENVRVFTHNRLEFFDFPRLGLRVYGAAYTDRSSPPLLRDFCAEAPQGWRSILCLHGEVTEQASPYAPIAPAQLASSGLAYAALGHIHHSSGLLYSGPVPWSQPGCPEGRGFDELGEKTVNLVTLSEGSCSLEQRSIASRRCREFRVDITGQEPLLAIHELLPEDTDGDVCRIVLTGEAETPPNLLLLQETLSDLFFSLQLRDETHPLSSLWEEAGSGTLRGLFLSRLKQRYDLAVGDERRRIEQAARWGLAALDNREEPVIHEDQ